MEVSSRDGGGGQTGSSSSGTTVSTTYHTSSGSGSHLSSSTMDATTQVNGLRLHDDEAISWEETQEKMRHIRSLVQEFFAASSSADGGMGALVVERWLMELGVGWVLHLPSGVSASASAWELDHTTSDALTWIQALKEIVDSINFTEPLLPDLNMPSVFEEQEEAEESSITDQFQSVRFIQEALLKMLSFVDVISDNATATATDPNPNRVPALYHRLKVLLPVRGALSDALSEMEMSFPSTTSPEVELIGDAMARLLAAKDGKARDAIWSTMEGIRTRIILREESMSMEGSSRTRIRTTPHGSSDIHKVTRSVMGHVNFLLDNYSSVEPIVSEAASLGKYVPHIGLGDQQHLDSMVMEITSCLEEKLANISESFPDQGLRFLFLLNNSYFMREKLKDNTLNSSLQVHAAALFSKVKGYMQTYLHVSWTPVLSCLFNPATPLCLFGKHYYPLALPKFESEFQKMYTTQKLWKVPDPELRASLRTSIIDKIIPVYTKYIEDNKTAMPKLTCEELEERLQELFEG